MVWAIMPFNKKTMEEIEESHRCRPYLVMYKDDKNIYAYFSSSSMTGNANNIKKYCIDKTKYGIQKDSWIDLKKIYKVPVYNLKDYFYTLKKEDFLQIKRRAELLKEKYPNSITESMDNYDITIGDIVCYKGNINYVYNCDKDKIYCYKLYRNSKFKKIFTPILIRNKKYFMDLDSDVKYNRNKKMELIDFASEIENNYIKENIIKVKKSKQESNSYRENKSKISKYKLGTLFQIKADKIAYLFTKDNKDYGINILTYNSNPSLYCIPEYRRKNIIGDIPISQCFKIIENLYLKKVKPQKNIEELYLKLKYSLK